MGPHPTKKSLPAKETINEMKTQSVEWENIFTSDTSDKKLIAKIYKEFIYNIEKNRQSNLKNGQLT